MRRYLLDTSVLSALLHNRAAAASLITPWLHRHEVATSILVYGEVYEYIRTRPNFSSHAALLRDLLSEIRPYFLTYPYPGALRYYQAHAPTTLRTRTDR